MKYPNRSWKPKGVGIRVHCRRRLQRCVCSSKQYFNEWISDIGNWAKSKIPGGSDKQRKHSSKRSSGVKEKEDNE